MLYCKTQIPFSGQIFDGLLLLYSNSTLSCEALSVHKSQQKSGIWCNSQPARCWRLLISFCVIHPSYILFLYSLRYISFLFKIPINKSKSSEKAPYCREFLGILHFKMKIKCYVGFDLPIPPLCDTPLTYPRAPRSVHVFCVLIFPQIMYFKERYLFSPCAFYN